HIEVPGRPEKPELVPVNQVKRRKLTTEEGRATLIHAIAHIEFNAINLALDAVYRFRDMPDDYYTDWLQVASEEAYHFSLLEVRLQQMGYVYGDMPAHNGLWESCINTEHDVMVRMALVPRVLEARGLDVTPGMMEKLQSVGDQQTVDILAIILRDEIGHVRIGSRWFHYCCEQRQLEPEATFLNLIKEYMDGALRGPFHREARLQAGFTEQELDMLAKLQP
ncbi:MAG: ferritin-like domain-containing protein, partial [Thiotrichaceae bacterium]